MLWDISRGNSNSYKKELAQCVAHRKPFHGRAPAALNQTITLTEILPMF
jgi:hypothetical protein